MCKASVEAKRSVPARRDTEYRIGLLLTNTTYMRKHAALYLPGESPEECVHCIPDNTPVTLIGIPADLQRTHNVPETVIARFLDPGGEKYDQLYLDDNRRLPLNYFAGRDVRLFLGEHVLEKRPAARADIEEVFA